ncbi:TlpA family protein disulfide reductase [Peribacillus sp. NPDC096448]|uniref:TlpA family protein disulfide reductase n=1 Tax=Peribacillus sp. NPDC096448 TaxID=3364395 RepID=UPI00380384F4
MECIDFLYKLSEDSNWLSKRYTKEYFFEKEYVIVYLWSTSCSFCNEIIPMIREFLIENKSKLRALSVHVPLCEEDLEVARVTKIVVEEKIQDPVLLDHEHVILSTLNAKFLPSIYLFNKDHEIVSKKIGIENIDSWFSSLRDIVKDQIVQEVLKDQSIKGSGAKTSIHF